MKSLSFLVILLFATSCHIPQPKSLDQNTEEAPITDIDKPLAHAFSALDGSWAGQFHIYEHTEGQAYQVTIPQQLTHDFLSNLSLKETGFIEVHQEYRSKTPYYQTVSITDTYQENGVPKEVKSTGVNKIQNGQIWCVVQKPTEKIVHLGSIPEKDVIIWQGHSADPFRKEYFYETVLADTYEIVGYGYYGQDDPAKNPKMWFWGKYERVF